MIIMMIISIIILYIKFNQIIMTLYNLLLSLNLESRTLDKIIHGSIFDDSNRMDIIDELINISNENVFGIGFMGNLSSHNIYY